MIDLRSDTVTQPTPQMRQAMAEAAVGDDVFGDDPTVNDLERLTAELLGKEAALFVPSGTMANQLAVRCHTRGGDEALMEAGAHICNHEAGAAAALSGVTCRAVQGRRGIFTAADLLGHLRASDVHLPPTRLVCVENTHNAGGGSVWPLAALAELARTAYDHGLAVHMDGARLWNASVASGVSEKEFARHCDSVGVCFSKGLGAPVGSALAGSGELVSRARHYRKMYGGGMRQAGILAAAALYALRHHRERLTDDHANAGRLAHGLAQISGVQLEEGPIETNIVYFRTPGRNAAALVEDLRRRGVLVLDTSRDGFRAVTHLMIGPADIDAALSVFAQVLQKT